MTQTKRKYDVVVCAGSAHFDALMELLPLLHPFGTVHLASSRLTRRQLSELEPLYDVRHEPQYHPDDYENFKLFCIRDINRIVSAPHFIKIDTDVKLRPSWIDYVEENLARRPDAVLFGIHSGSNRIDYGIEGPLVRRKLAADVRVRNGLKIDGSFYVANTRFFKHHDWTMQVLHDLIYGFWDGRRVRPSHLRDESSERDLGREGLVRLKGVCALRQGIASEDNVRSLTVHAVGSKEAMFVRKSGGRILVPDKTDATAPWKTTKKWVLSLAGVPWKSTKKAQREDRMRPSRASDARRSART